VAASKLVASAVATTMVRGGVVKVSQLLLAVAAPLLSQPTTVTLYCTQRKGHGGSQARSNRGVGGGWAAAALATARHAAQQPARCAPSCLV
jgi:hypothetical protein